MDPYGGGQLQFWFNGAEQIDLRNLPIGYNNIEAGVYWQYGIYRDGDPVTLAVRYADLRQGTAPLR